MKQISNILFKKIKSDVPNHACRKNGCHHVAYEAIDFTFNNILQPLRKFSSQYLIIG